MAKNPLEGVCWEGTFQGKPYYSAKCDIEALIISQDDSLPGVADAVPRLNCELMDSDQNQLERLGLLKTSPRDDASIMTARIDFDKRFTKVEVERSNHGGLSKTKVQEVIRNTMKTSTKPALYIWYFGPGKRNTGDWCFENGFITFRDITELYMQQFRGKILSVTCDCSYSGSWVTACAEFLDRNGVKPCAHSAKAKNIFISMDASCKDTEVPYSLLYSIRANTTDKNTGVLGIHTDGWEVSPGQHMRILTTTTIRCENKSIDASCTLEPDATWAKLLNNQRIFLVRGNDKGRPAWHYAQLVDDEETVRKFTELTQGENAGVHTINIEDYGQVIRSGWGHDPPNDVKEWMQKNYGAS